MEKNAPLKKACFSYHFCLSLWWAGVLNLRYFRNRFVSVLVMLKRKTSAVFFHLTSLIQLKKGTSFSFFFWTSSFMQLNVEIYSLMVAENMFRKEACNVFLFIVLKAVMEEVTFQCCLTDITLPDGRCRFLLFASSVILFSIEKLPNIHINRMFNYLQMSALEDSWI